MIQKTIYCCQFCGEEFSIQESARAHEAEHYGLTTEELTHWLVLSTRAAFAGHGVGVVNNPTTRAAFDQAIEALCNFETKHHLEHVERPRDWRL